MNTTSMTSIPFDFQLPADLECSRPTETRGIARDEVRLLVSHHQNDQLDHGQFRDLDQYLLAGDVLVVNTSATLAAALHTEDESGQAFRIHLSTRRDEHHWLVEVREVQSSGKTQRYFGTQSGQHWPLPAGGRLEILNPYYSTAQQEHLQLWEAKLVVEGNLESYLAQHGFPIRYGYVREPYPLAYYQTVFAREAGSAEMPSAGRAFTPELVSRLVAKGVQFAPLLLHTGVASLEVDERPYEEYYRVPATTAQIVNQARQEGRRIIAVGTTAIRALETVTDHQGHSSAGEGWTDTFISPQRGLYGVDGLITGFHEPRASHLLMLEALSGPQHLQLSYQAALDGAYQWHEFGDLHLLLP